MNVTAVWRTQAKDTGLRPREGLVCSAFSWKQQTQGERLSGGSCLRLCGDDRASASY